MARPAPPIPFNEFKPDQGDLATDGFSDLKNAIPGAQGYESFPTPQIVTNALDYYCRGLMVATDEDLVSHAFAGDDGGNTSGEARLYKLNTTLDWENRSTLSASASNTASVSTFYTLASGENWDVVNIGPQVIFAGWSNDIQAFNLKSGTRFAALSATAPQARHLASSRAFCLAGNVFDSGDGNVPWRIAWGPLNNPGGVWTPSIATLAGYRDLTSTRGEIRRVIGGRYVTVFQEEAISIGTYVGLPKVWDFEEAEDAAGTSVPRSVVKWRNMIFYLAADGFYMFTGSSSIPIGKDKVDRWFWRNVDQNNLQNIVGTLHHVLPLVMWVYPSNDAIDGLPDRVLFFNWKEQKWGLVEQSLECIGVLLSGATSIEDLDAIYGDIDSIPVSLDSRIFIGGQKSLVGFTSEHKAGELLGPPNDAYITTKEIQPSPGRKALVTNARPIVDYKDDVSLSLSMQVGGRERLQDTVTFDAVRTPLESTGDAPVLRTARFHRYRIHLQGEFQHAVGVEIEAQDDGDV